MSQTECNCGCNNPENIKVPVRGLELSLDPSAFAGLGGGTGTAEMAHFKVGVETKRNMTYNGKQVYSKLVDFGAVPKGVDKFLPHEIEDVEMIWFDDSLSMIIGGDLTYTISRVEVTSPTLSWSMAVTPTRISMRCGNSNLVASAIICLNYTKTTDPVIA